MKETAFADVLPTANVLVKWSSAALLMQYVNAFGN